MPVDAVVTSEDVGSYKPNHNHFTRFAESFGATKDNWVHVAQSYFHDMTPAHELGLPRIWINRSHATDDPAIAHAVLPGRDGLLRTVERVRSA